MNARAVALLAAPFLLVLAPSAQAAITVAPSQLDFPATKVFGKSAAKTFTITANGQDAFVSLSGPNSFTVQAPGNASDYLIPAGTASTITVTFEPTVSGPISEMATVIDQNDSNRSVPVILKGVGASSSSGGGGSTSKTCQGKKVTITAKGGTTRGTKGSDVILGSSKADRISGGGGKDVICGGAGNDRIDGGSGNDKIDGGSGNDKLSGGSGTDSLKGGSGSDSLSGGPGKDKLTGGPGKDTQKQ